MECIQIPPNIRFFQRGGDTEWERGGGRRRIRTGMKGTQYKKGKEKNRRNGPRNGSWKIKWKKEVEQKSERSKEIRVLRQRTKMPLGEGQVAQKHS